MKDNVCILLITSLLSINLCCANSSQQLKDAPVKRAIVEKIDSIKIRVPGKVSIIDDDLLMIVDDKDKIEKIVGLFNLQVEEKAGWRSEWDGHSFAPRPFLQLTFYKHNEIIGGFGIAREPDFFSTSDPELGYRIKYVDQVKIIEILELIGLSDEGLRQLERQFDQPGPWKKQ